MRKQIICEKCGKSFDAYRIIKDKMVTNYHRKYCFECKPMGCHNKTWDMVNGMRECNICHVSKSASEFQKIGNKGHLLRYCKTCVTTKQRIKMMEVKQRAVGLKGGKCQICGYDKCIGSLDFHHRVEGTKEFEISKYRRSFAKIEAELEKCDLLCANCHRELHYNIRNH